MNHRTCLAGLIPTLALVAAASAPAKPPEAKTVPAVLAADDDWLAAELRGDVTALNARLADEYQDIEADGRPHPKSRLLATAEGRKNKATGAPAEVIAKYRSEHPIDEDVVIVGDTAILSFRSKDPASHDIVLSVDVFTYQKGRWRGLLSKHTTVPTST